MSKVVEIADPVERLHVYCSLLMRGVEETISMLSLTDRGFVLQGETRGGEEVALRKLQSIADTFMVCFEDTHPTYPCASRLSEVLSLLNVSESRRILINPAVKYLNWKISVIQGWPFTWELVSELASEFVRLSGMAPFDFEASPGVIWLQDTSNTENPDFRWNP